jgi:hypothetical protein
MSGIDYTSIRQTPVNQLGQLRQNPLGLIAAFLTHCSPRAREAITQALRNP